MFASPKVGAHNFHLNPLPNLKVMRAEYGSDPNASGPANVRSCKYEHVGHTLGNSPGNGSVTAYRFDAKKPGFAGPLNIRKHDIQSDVKAMEAFKLYAGEDVGEGVRGKNNEKRVVA
jgi:hypothetical protein